MRRFDLLVYFGAFHAIFVVSTYADQFIYVKIGMGHCDVSPMLLRGGDIG